MFGKAAEAIKKAVGGSTSSIASAGLQPDHPVTATSGICGGASHNAAAAAAADPDASAEPAAGASNHSGPLLMI